MLVLDSVGVGEAPDADRYGDVGADTVGHIHARVGLSLPELGKLGFGAITPLGDEPVAGAFGRMQEQSAGKDTMTGHMELAGCQIDRPFPTFTETGFPDEVIARFCELGGLPGVLGNEAASGTEVIERLGAEHVATRKPIVYTSADSVFQLAAHEELYPLEEQYRLCRLAREQLLTGELAVARVIARPFVGSAESGFTRTKGRKDFALPAPGPTICDRLAEAGLEVVSVGKINDIFSGRGISKAMAGRTNDACLDDLIEAMAAPAGHELIFVNLVDFDTLYGHRNDPEGYRDCLQAFDRRLPEVLAALGDDDLLIITADHGNDPCHPGTDHTRELVPLLAYHRQLPPTPLGLRESFADVAQTIAENFATPPLPSGESFLSPLQAGRADA